MFNIFQDRVDSGKFGEAQCRLLAISRYKELPIWELILSSWPAVWKVFANF